MPPTPVFNTWWLGRLIELGVVPKFKLRDHRTLARPSFIARQNRQVRLEGRAPEVGPRDSHAKEVGVDGQCFNFNRLHTQTTSSLTISRICQSGLLRNPPLSQRPCFDVTLVGIPPVS